MGFIIYAVLAVYIDESVLNVDAQTAGTAKAPFSSATATTTYANNDNCYGPKFAIDGYSDSSGCNFFHSKATVPYPYLAATINALGQSITSVTLKSRCDANGWGHTQINLVVRAGLLPIDPTAAGYTGSTLLPAASGTLCNTFTGTVAQCSTVTINCAAAITTNVITVQLYTNGRNVHLMFEDLTYSTTDVTTVTLQTRCDANAWSCSVPNQINVEVRYGQVDIAAGKRGQLTENDLCGRKVGCDAAACQTHTITCDGGTKASHYITVQMLDATKTFLMLNEVTWA